MKVVLKDLVKQFANSDRAAVNKINLLIDSGELAVLLGPSGCGKTTTLRMIAGLEQPDSGRITVQERDITDLAPKDRRVAMVFQNFSMYPTMNVYDNIAFPLHAIKMGQKRDRQHRARSGAPGQHRPFAAAQAYGRSAAVKRSGLRWRAPWCAAPKSF